MKIFWGFDHWTDTSTAKSIRTKVEMKLHSMNSMKNQATKSVSGGILTQARVLGHRKLVFGGTVYKRLFVMYSWCKWHLQSHLHRIQGLGHCSGNLKNSLALFLQRHTHPSGSLLIIRFICSCASRCIKLKHADLFVRRERDWESKFTVLEHRGKEEQTNI